MASQSQGIQQLLAAEKKAAERVADARKSKLFSFLIFMQSGIQGWRIQERNLREALM